ncbi:MAG: hypothetical protein K5920_09365 [Bacteroidales bacterium]|nr:hypothetical protein [Bacteroidales bacterium]
MITTSVLNLSVSTNKFEKNAAVIIKEKETAKGKMFTFVTIPNVADRTEKAVLKSIIKAVLVDGAISRSDAEAVKVTVEKDEHGKVTKVTCKDENGKVVECKTEGGEWLQIHAAKIHRLISSFGKDSGYKIGYTDNEGIFHPMFTPEAALNNFLHIGTANIVDYQLANSDTKKVIVNNCLKATMLGKTQKDRFFAGLQDTTKKDTEKKSEKKSKKDTAPATA